jgi:hypothetical protein
MTQPLAPMGRPSTRSLPGAFPFLVWLLWTIFTVTPGTAMAAPPSDRGQERPFSPGQVGVCIQGGPDAGKLSKSARKQLPAARELEVGEWRIIGEVCPREKFFPTSVLLTPGATYEISAVGRWKDQWIRTGPEGWWFPPFHPFNRIPWHRMFVLSGSVGPTLEHAFVIGRQSTWTAPMVLPEGMGAELQLFPNDWASKYDNNRSLSPAQGGPMRVTILRRS